MTDTRRRILDTARRLFNERGLVRTGVRDVARELGMSPGNLAYHFATWDDLVAALVQDLYELDRRTVFAELPTGLSPTLLYRAAVAVMRNMLDYRFILLSYGDAVRSSPALREMEAELLKRRRERHERILRSLIDGGYIDGRRARPRSDYLFEQSELVSSGWLNAAAVRGWSDEKAVLHFAKVGIALLVPFATPTGTRNIRRILSGGEDRRKP